MNVTENRKSISKKLFMKPLATNLIPNKIRIAQKKKVIDRSSAHINRNTKFQYVSQ